MDSSANASNVPPTPPAASGFESFLAWLRSRTPQQRENFQERVRQEIVDRMLREIYGTEEIPARYLDPSYRPRQYTEDVHLVTAARLDAVQAPQSASTSTAPRPRRRNQGWRTRRDW